MPKPTRSRLCPLFGLGLLTLLGVFVVGFTSLEFIPNGFTVYLLAGFAAATGVAAVQTFGSSSIGLSLLLGTVVTSVAVGSAPTFNVLFVPPPPDMVPKFGNDLPAALFDGLLGSVLMAPVGFAFSGLAICLIRVWSRCFRRGTLSRSEPGP